MLFFLKSANKKKLQKVDYSTFQIDNRNSRHEFVTLQSLRQICYETKKRNTTKLYKRFFAQL